MPLDTGRHLLGIAREADVHNVDRYFETGTVADKEAAYSWKRIKISLLEYSPDERSNRKLAKLVEELKDLRNKSAAGHPPGWELMRDTMDAVIKLVEKHRS